MEAETMKIVVTGGGSGGHITPILAVAHELKKQQPGAEIVYIGQKGDPLSDVPAQDPNIDRTYAVRAGKLRRYHGEGLRQLLDVPTMLKNLRDVVWVMVGLWQSFWLLGKLKPDVIFTRGGFVSVPIALAAALRRIPYITHDSDALPSLANRLIAPWAKLHAVALPKEIYTYSADKTVTVGVPISHLYHPLQAREVKEWRQQLGLADYQRLLLVTGGGNGAQRLNNAVATCAKDLLSRYPDLAIVQLAGRDLEAGLRQHYKTTLSATQQKRVIVKGFVTNLHQYSGVADVIITRAGATSIAEFAAQAKACIIVPNPALTGGHQLKNAKVLADRKAVKMVSEQHLTHDPLSLMAPLVELLDNPQKAAALGKKLADLAQPDAARHLAMVLLEVAAKQPGR
jgi:UDP-N-acetylglucosamine--N-acetylmuramyl-(pentapeptide) pyrophosphoryl-undecaprenol N-acetylglucosamine transferase